MDPVASNTPSLGTWWALGSLGLSVLHIGYPEYHLFSYQVPFDISVLPSSVCMCEIWCWVVRWMPMSLLFGTTRKASHFTIFWKNTLSASHLLEVRCSLGSILLEMFLERWALWESLRTNDSKEKTDNTGATCFSRNDKVNWKRNKETSLIPLPKSTHTKMEFLPWMRKTDNWWSPHWGLRKGAKGSEVKVENRGLDREP